MYCFHCGHPLPADALFCPSCGAKLPVGTPPAGAPPSGTEQEPPPKIDCGLSLAIVGFCLGGVLGIIALIYAILAKDRYRSGDYEGARGAAKTGKLWSWAAILLFAAMFAAALVILPGIVEQITSGVLAEP